MEINSLSGEDNNKDSNEGENRNFNSIASCSSEENMTINNVNLNINENGNINGNENENIISNVNTNSNSNGNDNIISNANANILFNENLQSNSDPSSNLSYCDKPTIHQHGVDFDRICGYNPFMKEIFTRITCSICTLIPIDPLECKTCNTVVCRQCIEKWDKKECILRCGGELYDFPSRILRDIINSIVIKCRNVHRGCNDNLRLERLKLHEMECDFEEIKCPFIECAYVDVRKSVNAHIDKCEFNKIKCKFCKNLYRKSDFDRHIEKECEEVLMECEKCGKSERRKDFLYNTHNCVKALREEIKDLHKSINTLMENFDVLKFSYEELKRTSEDDKRIFSEKKDLMCLYISLLKSSCDPIFEDITSKIKPYNLLNPMQVPFIFRFMTSSRTVQITNLAEYSFTKINLSINFEIPTSHQSIVTCNKRIFIVGGVNHERKTYEFDLLNKTMLEKAEMNIGRRRHILTELRSGVFIATGGSNQAEEVLRDCEAYIMARNVWIKISSLNVPRFYHTAFSFNNSQLYVIGGCHTNNSSLVNLNSIERIDFNYELNGSWEILSIKDITFLKPRSRLSYLFVDSHTVLLFGGIPDYQPVFFNILTQEMSVSDSQFNIEGRFFFNDRCTWQNETLFISSQSTRCIFNHNLNCWEVKEFNEDIN